MGEMSEEEVTLRRSPYLRYFERVVWGHKSAPCWVCTFWNNHKVRAIRKDVAVKKCLAYVVTLTLSKRP